MFLKMLAINLYSLSTCQRMRNRCMIAYESFSPGLLSEHEKEDQATSPNLNSSLQCRSLNYQITSTLAKEFDDRPASHDILLLALQFA